MRQPRSLWDNIERCPLQSGGGESTHLADEGQIAHLAAHRPRNFVRECWNQVPLPPPPNSARYEQDRGVRFFQDGCRNIAEVQRLSRASIDAHDDQVMAVFPGGGENRLVRRDVGPYGRFYLHVVAVGDGGDALEQHLFMASFAQTALPLHTAAAGTGAGDVQRGDGAGAGAAKTDGDFGRSARDAGSRDRHEDVEPACVRLLQVLALSSHDRQRPLEGGCYPVYFRIERAVLRSRVVDSDKEQVIAFLRFARDCFLAGNVGELSDCDI